MHKWDTITFGLTGLDSNLWHRFPCREQDVVRGKSVRSWCDWSSGRSFMVDPLSYFSFQPVLHDWCNKGRSMCYPICGMVHIKESLLLIGKSNLCSGCSGFSLSLSEWFFTICPTSYNRKLKCAECVVNKTCPSFRLSCSSKSKFSHRDIVYETPVTTRPTPHVHFVYYVRLCRVSVSV